MRCCLIWVYTDHSGLSVWIHMVNMVKCNNLKFNRQHYFVNLIGRKQCQRSCQANQLTYSLFLLVVNQCFMHILFCKVADNCPSWISFIWTTVSDHHNNHDYHKCFIRHNTIQVLVQEYLICIHHKKQSILVSAQQMVSEICVSHKYLQSLLLPTSSKVNFLLVLS